MAASGPAPASAQRSGVLDRLGRSTEMWIAAATVMIVGLMIVPIPTSLLDLLLTLNITAAVLILLSTLYIENALNFSVFPTLLLIITLFRLSLNISGTRLILLHGF